MSTVLHAGCRSSSFVCGHAQVYSIWCCCDSAKYGPWYLGDGDGLSWCLAQTLASNINITLPIPPGAYLLRIWYTGDRPLIITLDLLFYEEALGQFKKKPLCHEFRSLDLAVPLMLAEPSELEWHLPRAFSRQVRDNRIISAIRLQAWCPRCP